MKNFLKNYYSWNSSLWLQNKASVLHKQKTHEMEWKKLLTRVFTFKCLKVQPKPLLVSKEWMLITIMLETHTNPWEFKQAYQRGNSGFQTARIILHWCELYESHLSNSKFLEPVSFWLCFSSIIICLSCFYVMPEKNLYTEATGVLHLLLTRRAISLCPLISQQHPSCLLRAQHASCSALRSSNLWWWKLQIHHQFL